MTPLRTLYTWAINWSLGIVVCFVVLLLNAYLDHKHPDTERLTAQVVNDRAAEHSAPQTHAIAANKE